MSRLLRALVTAVIGLLLGMPSAASAAVTVPHAQMPIYTYDNPHGVSAPTHATTERGPAAAAYAYAYTAAPSAGGHGSRGASARPQLSSAWTYTTYDHTVWFAQSGRSIGTTRTALGGRVADVRAVLGAATSAKSADGALTDVDDVLSGLAKGRSSGVRTAGSDAQLDEVYGTLSRGGTPIDIPGYKGTWIERSDGVRVGLRDASKSGGRTIDIRYPDGTTGKIHIE